MFRELIPGTIVLGFAALIATAAIVSWRRELRRAAAESAVADFFEPTQDEFDEQFAAIVAQFGIEADQRICDAHRRNMSELPEIDGGGHG